MNRVAAIQMTSSDSLEENLNTVSRWVEKCALEGVKLVVLPENVAFIGKKETDKLSYSEQPGIGPIQSHMAKLALQYNLWIVGGTLPIVAEAGKRAFASCWVWDNRGQAVARYDKIHLFDVAVSQTERYFESQTIAPGKDIVSIDSPVGRLGLTVCYDLRFPEFYRELLEQGSEVFVIPSAFTAVTGVAHWESLLRARAIENFCYVIAPNQTGIHANGRASYGHSMIVDPWGKILALKEEGEGIITAEIDLAYLGDIRARFPVLKHRKIL